MNETQLDLPLHIPANDVKTLLSRRELAARWGCSARTIGNMEAGGLLTPVRFNQRNIRYTLQNILAIEQTGKGAQ